MEIKARLTKPYTEEARIEFIVTQNHNNGYEIRETETELQAWGSTDTEKFNVARIAKYAENDSKASEARYGKEFYVTIQEQECLFDTTAQTQADLLTAFSVCSSAEGATYDGWVTNNNITVNLTLADVIAISTEFKTQSNIYPYWSHYQTLIGEATTLAELDAIVIDYNVNLAEEAEEEE